MSGDLRIYDNQRPPVQPSQLEKLIRLRNQIANRVLEEDFGQPLPPETFIPLNEVLDAFISQHGYDVQYPNHKGGRQAIAKLDQTEKGIRLIVITDKADGERIVELQCIHKTDSGVGARGCAHDIDFSMSRKEPTAAYLTFVGIHSPEERHFKQALEATGRNFDPLREAATPAYLTQPKDIPSIYLGSRSIRDKDKQHITDILSIVHNGSPSNNQEATNLLLDLMAE